ncbi:MAG TPA: right-handed parallel beta-helix repeat-containing protein, partial [Candidatus Acidoferrales bacterium]|nr:right-handed parallel beta-helix repeat-containing protein [Candidatus Acidoferrales bacterium]
MSLVERPRAPRGCQIFVGLVLLASLATTADATVYFVRITGSDTANGLTPATALASVNKAASLLSNWGDSVIVGPGTYDEGNVTPPRDGIEGHPVSFIADTNGTVTGDTPGAVVLKPSGAATTGFLLLGRHHVLIDGFTIIGASDAGIQVRRSPTGIESNTITIRNVIARDGARRGIDISAFGPVVIQHCIAQNNASAGINIIGTAGLGATVNLDGNNASNNRSHGFFL